MQQRWRGVHGCQQGVSPSPAPKSSLCHPPREAQPRLFQGKGSGGWCQSEPWQGLCAAPASSCGICTILTHLVSPGPKQGLLPRPAAVSTQNQKKATQDRSKATAVLSPKCLISPFLQHSGAVIHTQAPSSRGKQGGTRQGQLAALLQPPATLGSWSRGKGSAPLFSSAKSGPGKFLTLGLAKPLKQQTPGLGFALCHQRTNKDEGPQGTHHRGTLPLCPQKHNPNPIPAPWGAGGWITGGWITGGGERAALGGSNPKQRPWSRAKQTEPKHRRSTRSQPGSTYSAQGVPAA